MEQIEKAIRYGKHIIAEKPVADTMENEWKVVEMAASSDAVSYTHLDVYKRQKYKKPEEDLELKVRTWNESGKLMISIQDNGKMCIRDRHHCDCNEQYR